jgi:hypothetical protein
VGHNEVEILIDSGANISIINYEAYGRMDHEERPVLKVYGIPMVTADGTPMKVYGYADFVFEIGDEPCSYASPLCVADVGVDMILGYDFLRRYEAVIDMGKSMLELHGMEATGTGDEAGSCSRRECHVIISRTMVVPAGSEAIAQGECVGAKVDFIGLIEPMNQFQGKHGMLVACAVVSVGAQGVPVRLFNAGDGPVTVYRNTMAALCQEVEVIENREKFEVGKEQEIPRDMPAHMRELYEESCGDMSEENSLHLKSLLMEYASVFSADDLDMGKTDLIRHCIDTQNAHPVKQRMRRVPLHMKGIVKGEVDKLLLSGLIEPSMSPWASSLVLVKKLHLD